MYGQKAFVCERKWDALVYMFEDDVVPRINYFNALQFLIPLGKSQ
jgi:hypothetical protein